MATNLSEIIQTEKVEMDPHLCYQWQNIKDIVRYNYKITESTVTPAIARKYRGDLVGLFRYEFNIDNRFIYIHAICNGFDGLTDYNGKKTTFTIYDQPRLDKYYKKFTKDY